MMFYNCDEIKTFRELMTHICYDWGFDENNLIRVDDGFVINKTYITKDSLIYKKECFPLAYGLYEKLEKFYELLTEHGELERKK